jgi:hypothetical protein
MTTIKRIHSRIGLIELAISKTRTAKVSEQLRFFLVLDHMPTPELASIANSVKVSNRGHISFETRIARIPNKRAYRDGQVVFN